MAGIILGILLILVGLLLVSGWLLSNVMLNPKPWDTLANIRKQEFHDYGIRNEDWDAGWNREDFAVQSQYGYTLRGTIIPRREKDVPADGHELVVVIAHGFGACLYNSAKYAALLRDFGFTTILYDHRNHGGSDKAPTTMGWYEANDLKTICEYARAKYGADCILGTHGESMGAATVMLNSALDTKLSFVIEDCGYSDLVEQLSRVVKKWYHLPAWLFMPPALWIAQLRSGVDLRRIKPADAVKNSGSVPMLFLHGEADDFVPFYMLQKNYDAKTTGLRMQHAFPGAEHAKSYASDPETYRRVVKEFLVQAGILPAQTENVKAEI
jgi:fermentation-respiration switch protein FrsA (DUF1100 family)